MKSNKKAIDALPKCKDCGAPNGGIGYRFYGCCCAYFNGPKTARQITRQECGDKPLFMLPVPLLDDRQMYYLRTLAGRGILGETPGEIAAHFITYGILSYMGNNCAEDYRLYRPNDWKGFKP